MANEFYITRQFGVNIFIDVEKGVVTNVRNEGESFINKMHELYKGKSISFLKEDFEERMKPACYLVRNCDVVTAIRNVEVVKMRLRHINNSIDELKRKRNINWVGRNAAQNEAEAKAAIDLEMAELEKSKENALTELDEVNKNLENIKEQVKQTHNFN